MKHFLAQKPGKLGKTGENRGETRIQINSFLSLWLFNEFLKIGILFLKIFSYPPIFL